MAHWLVTGGCGFIGSHLVEALLGRGDRVRVLDDLSTGKRYPEIDRAELLVGDVSDPRLVEQAMLEVDGCFHLAAIASVQRCNDDWLGTHCTNLTGTITVLDAARKRRPTIPIVYASSAAVYGENPQIPLKETDTACPLSAYGADKRAGELHARIAWSVHKVPNVGLRFFNVYGPRQDPDSPYSGVISIFANRIGQGKTVEVFGDGNQLRDFVYVGDVVKHLLEAMAMLRTGGAHVFNVCTGRATSVLELIGILSAIAGREPRIMHRPARAGDIRISVGDPGAAVQALGLSAATPIKDGLRRTLDALAISPAISGRIAAGD